MRAQGFPPQTTSFLEADTTPQPPAELTWEWQEGEERNYCRQDEEDALLSHPFSHFAYVFYLLFLNVQYITGLGNKDRTEVSHP